MSDRSAVLLDLASYVDAATRHLGHPARVAVDGITASGKTTLARELTAAITSSGRDAQHLTMDGYHHQRDRRYRQGRESADGYYEDAYDFVAFAEEVLRVLGEPCAGACEYRTRIIDLAADTPITGEKATIAADGCLVVDGSFLQRPETKGLWDLVVFVDTSFEVARARGVEREADALGGREAAERLFDVRYHAAARRYVAEVDPRTQAHVVLRNDDVEHPSLVIQT